MGHTYRGVDLHITMLLLIISVVEAPIIYSQPSSQKDILPGRSVIFTIQATGTEPMRYQWQWKQFGKKNEWQNLSNEGSTLQVAEVQLCNEGCYRCVVANYAGSKCSQWASLIVGKYVH